MNNEPVAWMFEKDGAYMCIKHDNKVNYDGGIPLYTHPHPDNLGLAESIIKQQQAEIEHLKGLIVLLKMQVNGLKKASEK